MSDSDDIDVKPVSGENKLKLVGELMSNEIARKIILILQNEPVYKNEVAKKLGIPFNLIDHHLKKLEEIGWVKIVQKPIAKKGINHKMYKINSRFLLIDSQNMNEEKTDDNILRRLFKEGVKFAGVGIAAFFSYFITVGNKKSEIHDIANLELPSFDEMSPVVIPLIVVILGLLLLYYIKNND